METSAYMTPPPVNLAICTESGRLADISLTCGGVEKNFRERFVTGGWGHHGALRFARHPPPVVLAAASFRIPHLRSRDRI